MDALKTTGTNLPEAARWKEIADHLAPLPVIKAGDTSIKSEGSGYKLMKGFFKGEASPTDEIMAAGWGIKENKFLTVYFPVDDTLNHGLKLLDGIFPSVPSSPVFPSGQIGLTQKGRAIFNQVKATTLIPLRYAINNFGFKKSFKDITFDNIGIGNL